jgi:prephenate dehydrogenase
VSPRRQFPSLDWHRPTLYNAGVATYDKIAIVGPGLIGGSIGLAVRERKLARHVIGIGRRESGLDAARAAGAIDHGTTSLREGVADAELVVVCTPVDTITEMAVQAAASCRPTALITDVGSTKAEIVAAVDAALAPRRTGPRFVGSHPLAGDDRGGVEFARADLFDDRTVVISPTSETRPAAVVEATGFWQGLGAHVTSLTPAEHDAALAATSHLPHLLAAALAAATPRELLPLAASGWRDTTRVAGGDPGLWQPIFATNREHVVAALDRLLHELSACRNALEQADDQSLLQMLEKAQRMKRSRDALGD